MSSSASPLPSSTEKVPVPVGVLMQVIQTLRGGGGGDSLAAMSSSSSPCIDVEVETVQGYIYAGKLIDIDVHYNMTLAEATVRRERPCDLERALRRKQYARSMAALGLASGHMNSSDDSVIPAERADAPTRPRFLGSTLIRSSNLLMVVFVTPAADKSSSNSAAGAGASAGAPAVKNPSKSGVSAASRGDLASAFKSTAIGVKKALDMERRKNREARRKRIKDAAKTKKTAEASGPASK